MLDSDILHNDPLKTFETWFHESLRTSTQREPRAMALATLSSTGEIHNRIVLLKQMTSEGLIFFTNYNSAKGADLDSNPQCEVVFYWDHVFKQARLGGTVEKTSTQVSDDYWNSRARDSQIASYASHQSTPVKDRAALDLSVQQVEKQFDGKPVPRPSHWGGFLLRPNRIELWVGGNSRLHDRYHFSLDSSGWTSSRLYP